jgi:hypothetical protein
VSSEGDIFIAFKYSYQDGSGRSVAVMDATEKEQKSMTSARNDMYVQREIPQHIKLQLMSP